MTELRCRGQEVSILLAQENTPLVAITALKDFTATFKFKILEEGYLGRLSISYDNIFEGASGTFTVHHEGVGVFAAIAFIRDQAQRKVNVSTSRMNAKATFAFPNGDRPRLLIKDMKFGEIPINVPARDQYVNSTFPFNAEDIKVITT